MVAVGGVSLRILDPGVNPLARGLLGDVLERRRIIAGHHARTVGLHDRMAAHAPITRDQLTAQIQLRRSQHGPEVTLAAG